MNVLSTMRVKGFQCHERQSIEFDRITTIVGASDTGKSAAIRALIWALVNQPGGEDFINVEADHAAVQLTFSDGTCVTRKKGKSTNLYQLDGEDYVSFRNGVPEPISDYLRVDAVNIQSQHDPMFWVSSTPGDIVRQMNSIVDLSKVDDSLRSAKLEAQRGKTAYEAGLREEDAASTRIEELDWVVQLIPLYEEIQEREKQIEQISATIEGIDNAAVPLRAAIAEIESDSEKMSRLAELGKSQRAIKDKVEEAQKLETIVRDVSALVLFDMPGLDTKMMDAHTKTINDAASLSQLIDDLRVLERSDVVVDMKSCGKFVQLVDQLAELRLILTTIPSERSIAAIEEEELAPVLEDLKKIKKCPTCHRVI